MADDKPESLCDEFRRIFPWWFWPYALSVGLTAFLCTRGDDGNVLLTIILLPALALAYWIGMFFRCRLAFSTVFAHLLVLEGVTIAALLINPQLQELSGLLNYLVVIIVFATVVGGAVAGLLRRGFSRATPSTPPPPPHP